MTDQPDIERVLEKEAERFERQAEVQSDQPFARPAPAQAPSQVYAIRLPVDVLEQLRRLAVEQQRAPSALIREWVIERLERELSGGRRYDRESLEMVLTDDEQDTLSRVSRERQKPVGLLIREAVEEIYLRRTSSPGR